MKIGVSDFESLAYGLQSTWNGLGRRKHHRIVTAGFEIRASEIALLTRLFCQSMGRIIPFATEPDWHIAAKWS